MEFPKNIRTELSKTKRKEIGTSEMARSLNEAGAMTSHKMVEHAEKPDTKAMDLRTLCAYWITSGLSAKKFMESLTAEFIGKKKK